MVKVYAPASIGNIGVGFDVLGAAISPIDGSLLGDCVTIQHAKKTTLINEGRFAAKLPSAIEDNIVFHCWQHFCSMLGREIPLSLKLEKNMPIGSGLGSSACSVVAALVAMNRLCDDVLTPQQLLSLMGEMEGLLSGGVHYDNVAPCYLGGIQLILQQQNRISQAIPGFEDWLWIMAYPGIKVSTAQARAILPPDYKREDCVQYGRHLAGFIHACYTQQSSLATSLMQDVIAEPYRTKLLPGFLEARLALTELGAMACGISGSGPTLFSITDNKEIADRLVYWLQKNYIKNEEGFVHICRLDKVGARQLG